MAKLIGAKHVHIGESVARQTVRDEYPSSEGYEIYNEVDLLGPQGNDAGEFDFVVVDENDNIVEIYEVKAVDGEASGGLDQAERNLDRIGHTTTNIDSEELDLEQFTSNDPDVANSESIEVSTVGPSSDGNYDLQMPLTAEEFNTLTDIITARNNN